MAVPIQTPYNIYTANGVTTVFPYEFLILDAGDLTVSINGNPVSSGFSITGVGTTSGGEVIFLTPPTAGATVMNLRDIPATRLQNYQDNGDLLAVTVNKDFDRLWLAIQQSYLYLGLSLQRPLLGGPFNAHGYRIENLADPINPQDAATKNYVLVKIAESDAAGADALARERAERIASDIAIRTETGVGLGKTVRFPYAQPIITGDTAKKIFATDAQGIVHLVNLDDATRTDLAVDLASTGNPGGAGLVGYKGTTIAEVLNLISSVTVGPFTDSGMYCAWPQGKVFSHKNKAYCLYNVGDTHSNAALSVYQQISEDGVGWTRPAPRLANTNPTTWPQGVSAWGAGSDGSNIWMAARFRRVSDESQSKCVLYKSTTDGSVYTPVLDPVPLYDSTGKAPVLMHSFASLPNGLIAFGYHMYDGEVGIVTIDPNTYAIDRNIIFTAAEMNNTPMLVEPTMLVYGTRTVGFLRTQDNSTHPAVMWYSDDNCQTFQIRNIDGVPNQSPISITSYNGKTYIFYCGRYRDGNTNSARTNSPVLTMRVGNDNDALNLLWENFVEIPLAAVPSIYNDVGASATGVQDVCLRGSKIVVCLSTNVGGNVDQADVCSVTIDLGTPRQNKFFLNEGEFQKRRSTDYPSNYKYGTVNIINMGNAVATLRMNGMVVAQDQSDSLRLGSTASAGNKLLAINNGPAPALLSADGSSTNVRLWASSGVAEVRAGTALSNASIILNTSTKSITLRNPNNEGGISLTPEGYTAISCNWQHPMALDGGSGGKIYLWVSGTNNIMKHSMTPPTSDSDGEFLVPNKTTTVAGLGTGTDTARYAYATNGRRAGEASGSGSGVPVYWDGATWRVYFDNSVVAA
ncbi:Catalytic beta propeller domain of bacteriophage endosialidase [Serratia quinivorans]|uniref:phage tail fiber domain-containing protein n=1 Tax=Serratia quinivorans TaxID=137545 RepID=UPI000D91074E|nr:phage tail fiber protein [Serratia quinivorans]SPZ65448.1 Catalytic beta propeller domain of bacteriophage endosialidase [Serratia quinivorans]VEI70619.1 Catalytic beta propeller domain of bacteriophage endosialidase [Serratia quinivorans]